MNWIVMLPLLIRAAGMAQQVEQAIAAGSSVRDLFKGMPEILDLLKKIGVDLGLKGDNAIDGGIEQVYGRQQIEMVQRSLNVLGYGELDVDGLLGKQTRAAVKKFQKEYGGLEVDGWPGPKTREALRKKLGV